MGEGEGIFIEAVEPNSGWEMSTPILHAVD